MSNEAAAQLSYATNMSYSARLTMAYASSTGALKASSSRLNVAGARADEHERMKRMFGIGSGLGVDSRI